MEPTKFIFTIDAEKQYNALVRILTTINRQRLSITEFSSHLQPGGDTLRVVIALEHTREGALKLSRRLDREVDIITVTIFEQLYYKV